MRALALAALVLTGRAADAAGAGEPVPTGRESLTELLELKREQRRGNNGGAAFDRARSATLLRAQLDDDTSLSVRVRGRRIGVVLKIEF